MNRRSTEFPIGHRGFSDHSAAANDGRGFLEEDIKSLETQLIPQKLLKLARRLKAIRSSRESMFHASLFGEPAWDMMLALYIAEGEGYRLKVSDLCNESGVPDTTALRWIDRFIELGMASRRPNPLDARSNFIEMHADTTRRMTAFLEKIWGRYFPLT